MGKHVQQKRNRYPDWKERLSGADVDIFYQAMVGAVGLKKTQEIFSHYEELVVEIEQRKHHDQEEKRVSCKH